MYIHIHISRISHFITSYYIIVQEIVISYMEFAQPTNAATNAMNELRCVNVSATERKPTMFLFFNV